MFKLGKRDQLFQRTVGVLVIVSALTVLGLIHLQRQAVSPFGRTLQLRLVVPRADGMAVKSPVTMAGIKVGWVDDLALTADNQVLLTLTIDAKVSDKLRTDSLATVVKPMFGTAFVEIQMGREQTPVLQNGATIAGQIRPDLTDIVATLPERLNKVERTIESLNALSDDLRRLTHAATAGSSSVAATLRYMDSTARKSDTAADKFSGVLDEARITLGEMKKVIATSHGILDDVQIGSRQFGPIVSKVDGTLDDIRVLTQEFHVIAPQIAPAVVSGRHAVQAADDVLGAAKKSIVLRGEFSAVQPPPLPLLTSPR